MKGNMLMFLLLASSIGLALSNPLLPQCMQPPASGLCLAYFPSYYYNPSTKSCESFIYGGCQGNANRFATIGECLAKCGGYEPETNEAFTLITEAPAEERESSEEQQEQQSEENICFQPSVTGPCRANMPRFYFNAEDDKCETFMYGGCQGNDNNFKTVEECRQKCEDKSSEEVDSRSEDSSEEKSEETDSKTEE